MTGLRFKYSSILSQAVLPEWLAYKNFNIVINKSKAVTKDGYYNDNLSDRELRKKRLSAGLVLRSILAFETTVSLQIYFKAKSQRSCRVNL